MKKAFFFIIICIASLTANAQTNKLIQEQGKLHICYQLDYLDFEIDEKILLFKQLASNYLSTKHDERNLPNIYIYFEQDRGSRKTPYTAIGYDAFEYKGHIQNFINNNHKAHTVKGEGLVISILSSDFDIPTAMRLLHYGLSNVEYVIANQQAVNYDSLNIAITAVRHPCIRQEVVDKAKMPGYPSLEKVMLDTIFPGRTGPDTNTVGYNYGGQKFNFYNTHPNSPKYGKVFLSTNNLLEIARAENNAYMIFDTDSTFYFINKEQDTAIGPYMLNTITRGRPPLRQVGQQAKLEYQEQQQKYSFVQENDNNEVASTELITFSLIEKPNTAQYHAMFETSVGTKTEPGNKITFWQKVKRSAWWILSFTVMINAAIFYKLLVGKK